MRELKIHGLRAPSYNRRADLVCFVNGLPLVFIELKAVYKNIRAGFDGNLRDYLDENVIAHAFHHNAFLIVSNGHRARYGSITSQWEHFAEWKRMDETSDKGSVEAEVLARRDAGARPAARPGGELHPVRRQQARRDAQSRRPQPSGARRQQRGGIGAAAGGVEAAVPAGEAAHLSRRRSCRERRGDRRRHAPGCRRPIEDEQSPKPCRTGGVGASRPRQAGRLLAHAGQRQVVFDGVLRREGAAADFGEVHLPADDRPQRPRQPDLPHIRRLRRGRRQDAAGQLPART